MPWQVVKLQKQKLEQYSHNWNIKSKILTFRSCPRPINASSSKAEAIWVCEDSREMTKEWVRHEMIFTSRHATLLPTNGCSHSAHIRTTFLSFVAFAPMKSLTLFLMWPAFSNSVGFGLVVSWWRKSRRSFCKVIVRLLYFFLFSSEKSKKSEKIYLWKKFFWFSSDY